MVHTSLFIYIILISSLLMDVHWTYQMRFYLNSKGPVVKMSTRYFLHSQVVLLIVFILSSIGIFLISNIRLHPLYIISGSCPLLSPCIPPSLPAAVHPPSPTRWPSLRVKAVFPAATARHERCCSRASPPRPKLSQHTGELSYTQGGEDFYCSTVWFW